MKLKIAPYLTTDILRFPVKSVPVRQQVVRQLHMCPECKAPLDTATCCTSCGYDASGLLPKVVPIREDA